LEAFGERDAEIAKIQQEMQEKAREQDRAAHVLGDKLEAKEDELGQLQKAVQGWEKKLKGKELTLHTT
jgi:seryl-tRNA synthetase